MAALPDLGWSGRTVWISGASRGIGLATARLLAELGARVVGLDLHVSTELSSCAARACELDIASSPAVSALAEELCAAELAPDALVNNAGIARDAVSWKLDDESWQRVLDVNLSGAFYLTRAAIPQLRARGGGAIVNVASINGERGKFGQASYSASKAGLIGLTKTLARELGRFGIRVNAVAPGLVETELAADLPAEVRTRALEESLLGKIAAPDDIARAIAFLGSAWAGHITGHVLRVDGGQYL
ncbi:MAG: SDR family oxidoreductase [Planctomycetes bacterium]|nr:SDR family oxidoreductase [Planctomycetota bacterium]